VRAVVIRKSTYGDTHRVVTAGGDGVREIMAVGIRSVVVPAIGAFPSASLPALG
jgi:hypothetical protein